MQLNDLHCFTVSVLRGGRGLIARTDGARPEKPIELLKGAGYLNLRLGDIDTGVAMLSKVIELDAEDRLGAVALLKTVEDYERRKAANFGKLSVVG